MAKRISEQQMIERIKKGTHYIFICSYDNDENGKPIAEYHLCSGSGNKPGVIITEERAKHWMALGAEVLDYR